MHRSTIFNGSRPATAAGRMQSGAGKGRFVVFRVAVAATAVPVDVDLLIYLPIDLPMDLTDYVPTSRGRLFEPDVGKRWGRWNPLPPILSEVLSNKILFTRNLCGPRHASGRRRRWVFGVDPPRHPGEGPVRSKYSQVVRSHCSDRNYGADREGMTPMVSQPKIPVIGLSIFKVWVDEVPC